MFVEKTCIFIYVVEVYITSIAFYTSFNAYLVILFIRHFQHYVFIYDFRTPSKITHSTAC